MITQIIGNRQFSVSIKDDKMKAFLSILRIGDEDINIDDVLKVLEEKSITFGIKTQVIRDTIKKVNDKKVTLDDILIAEGLTPIDGEDGKVEFLFDLHNKVTPHEDEGGHIDFHDLHMVENVKKDQPLARLIPPTQPQAGKNVLGKEIMPEEGKPSKLPPLSENTKLADNDKNLIVSCIDGNVKFEGGTIQVNSTFIVHKDVDFSIGNITYNGSIVVKGDVKSGFCLNAEGDIEIWGTVGDASIKSGKSVTVKCGFIGTGKGKIEAKDNIHMRFARNQTVIAENVIIDNEAIDCTICAKDSVIARGNKISIEGGLTSAGNKIEANVLGNRSELPTVVQVGIDYTAKRRMIKLSYKISKINSEIESIDKDLKSLNQQRINCGKTNRKVEYLVSRKEELNQKLSDLTDQEKIMSKNLKINKDATIVIKNRIYPGVKIEIADAKMTAIDEIQNTTLYLSKGEIMSG